MMSDSGAGDACQPYFSVPGHTPVIFCEVGGRALFRLLARDAGGDTEQMLLNETVPSWVVDVVVHVSIVIRRCHRGLLMLSYM